MSRLFCVLCLLAQVPFAAHATLQEESHPTFGPGSITLDTDTSLEWLRREDLP